MKSVSMTGAGYTFDCLTATATAPLAAGWDGAPNTVTVRISAQSDASLHQVAYVAPADADVPETNPLIIPSLDTDTATSEIENDTQGTVTVVAPSPSPSPIPTEPLPTPTPAPTRPSPRPTHPGHHTLPDTGMSAGRAASIAGSAFACPLLARSRSAVPVVFPRRAPSSRAPCAGVADRGVADLPVYEGSPYLVPLLHSGKQEFISVYLEDSA
jgi:hypothetical protein